MEKDKLNKALANSNWNKNNRLHVVALIREKTVSIAKISNPTN